MAGAERFIARAGNDGDAERGFGIKPGEEGVRFPLRGVGERVHGVWAVDGHEEDVRGWVGDDVGWCWGRFGLKHVCHSGQAAEDVGRQSFAVSGVSAVRQT